MSNSGSGQKYKNPVLSSEQEQDETGVWRGQTQLWAPFPYSELNKSEHLLPQERLALFAAGIRWKAAWGHPREAGSRKASFWARCCGSLWSVLSTWQPAQPGLGSAASEQSHSRRHRQTQQHQISHAASTCVSAKGPKGPSLAQPRCPLPSSWGSTPSQHRPVPGGGNQRPQGWAGAGSRFPSLAG